jgi:hypothetical protein
VTLVNKNFLNQEWLQTSIQIHLLDKDGNFDRLARDLLKQRNVFARAFVVHQRMHVCKAVGHPRFQDVDLTKYTYERIDAALNVSRDAIVAGAVKTSDGETLRREATLGSDVAHTQSTEVSGNVGDDDAFVTDGEEGVGDAPIDYTYVSTKPHGAFEFERIILYSV